MPSPWYCIPANLKITLGKVFLMKFLTLFVVAISICLEGHTQNITYFCSFCHKGPYNTYEAARQHTCANHNWGCPAAAVVPTGPTPEELKKMREEKDLKEASEDANDKGIECYKKRDWACAIKFFMEALDYDQQNGDAEYNLKKAKEEAYKEEEARIRTMIIEQNVVKPPKLQQPGDEDIRNGFLRAISNDSFNYNRQLQKLMNDVSKIKVPPPKLPRKIHEGVILGLFNTDEKNAITDTSKHVVSSFTGKGYKKDEFFATSDQLSAKELLRGVIDNSYLGEYTLNTDHGKKLVERLQGTQFDRLIAHSNGATVSEALIRKGVITVNELNIVGGDRSLINNVGLQELITTGKVKRIVVWINPGDVIPYGSSAGLMSPLAGARDQYIGAAASYFSTMLSGQNKGGDSKVEYRFLKGPQYEGQELKFGKDVFDAHGLEVYQRNMQKYFEVTGQKNK